MENLDKLTLKELENMPTISSSQFDDLKYETETYRVLLSRMTIADGMKYNNCVTIEAYDGDVWFTIDTYEAL